MPEQTKTKRRLHAVPDQLGLVEPSAQFSDPDECPLCYGTGMQVIEGKGAKFCVCRKTDTLVDAFITAQIPKRYESCQFDTYESKHSTQRVAKKLAQDFTLNFPAIDRGLLFIGNVGVGKTHLSVSILKGLSERGFNCLFYEFSSLLKEIQNSYNPSTFTSELSVLAPVLRADVLVLDELGSSKPTDWVQDTLAHIINTRYNDRKFTIFTTNYPDDRVDQRRENLEDRIGIRTRSRLFEMCRTVNIEGPDHRRTFDRAAAAIT